MEVLPFLLCHRMSLKKRQFVVTHTIRQNEIPLLLGSWFTNAF